MNLHDLDKLTDKEQRQLQAGANYFMNTIAHERRKQTMEAKTKTELEIEDDQD